MTPEQIVSIYIPATLIMIMLAMGLGLKPADFRRVVEQPRAVATGAFAQLIGLPALGFALAFLFTMPPELAVGLVLVSACPGGPSSNLMTNLAGGDTALSVSLTAVSGFATILTIPLIGNLAVTTFAGTDSSLMFPVGETIVRIFIVVGIPLFVGMWINHKKPEHAAKLEPMIKRAAVVMLTLLIIGALFAARSRLAQFSIDATFPAITLSIVGMTAGLVTAALLGLERPQRLTITLEVGAQNAALAIGLAVELMKSDAAAFPAVIYGTFMYLPCALVIWLGRRGTL